MEYFDAAIRVRYAETDKMGVSYYGNYFTWFEVGRNEYFRALNLPYTIYEKQSIYLPVGEAYCRYYKPLTYDDYVIIRTGITLLKQSSMKFTYNVYKKSDKELVAEGHTTHIFVDANMKPCRIPDSIKENVTLIKEFPPYKPS